jgi:hypothetical protein
MSGKRRSTRGALGELERRKISNPRDPFPLSSPLCLGKGGKQENPLELPLISSLDLANKEGSEPVDWLVENLIPKGTIILLTAPPGSYKTLRGSGSEGAGNPYYPFPVVINVEYRTHSSTRADADVTQ